jgi:hypothetical protein
MDLGFGSISLPQLRQFFPDKIFYPRPMDPGLGPEPEVQAANKMFFILEATQSFDLFDGSHGAPPFL